MRTLVNPSTRSKVTGQVVGAQGRRLWIVYIGGRIQSRLLIYFS